MFDDKLVVESPGRLPGLVKTGNIRHTHFSRNPKIAEFLKDYKYVKEYGEGVNRMFDEMATAGLPEPEYYKNDFMLMVILNNDRRHRGKMYGTDFKDSSWVCEETVSYGLGADAKKKWPDMDGIEKIPT